MKPLKQLLALLADFGADATAHKLALLRELRKIDFDRARDLSTLQRIICFLRAFPDDERVERAARRLARGFAARVARLARAEGARLDDTGTAGTSTRHVYSYTGARWLARRYADTTEIDWKGYESPESLSAVLQPLLDPFEDEHAEFDAAGVRAWIRCAKGDRAGSDLRWLLAQVPATAKEAKAFEQAYAAAEVPIEWRIGGGRAAMVHNAFTQPLQFRGDGMRKPSADPVAAIRAPLAGITLLSRRDAVRLLDVWRTALWSRTRNVFQMEQANFEECYLCDFGRGLAMAAVGVRHSMRSVLEVNYGYLLLANGMPIGYGGFTALFHQANTGINVFPEYRGGEAAYTFEQALRAMRTLTGCDHVIINPYQFGAGNDEALASGSYWFYYRLGFRSVDAGVQRLAAREFERMRAERGYRVPIATLRKLAACDLRLDLSDRVDRLFDENWLPALGRGITAAIAREPAVNRGRALAQLTRRIAQLLNVDLTRWSARERTGFAQFAPILAQIDDLSRWPEADRRALGELTRSRWATNERDFAARMRAHERLRLALARAAVARAQGGAQVAALRN